jgi:hypothetical protein
VRIGPQGWIALGLVAVVLAAGLVLKIRIATAGVKYALVLVAVLALAWFVGRFRRPSA